MPETPSTDINKPVVSAATTGGKAISAARLCWIKLRSFVIAARGRLAPLVRRAWKGLLLPWRGFKKLPKRIRISAVILVALGVVFYLVIPSNSAKLRVVCQHNFHSAQLSIWVDGDLVYSDMVSGAPKKRGPSKKRQAGLSTVINVPEGRHTVQVTLSSPEDGYEQTRTAAADFSNKKESLLMVTSGRRNLVLAMQSGGNSPMSSSPYQKYAGSVLLSILGSGMSAMISFIVQDFLRTQKQRLASGSTNAG